MTRRSRYRQSRRNRPRLPDDPVDVAPQPLFPTASNRFFAIFLEVPFGLPPAGTSGGGGGPLSLKPTFVVHRSRQVRMTVCMLNVVC